ncbi:hypothetical protein THIOM_001011 [Candidatus Thiomargarita nelsonii]|uniref:Uncharacterized protein n=1 Tax=Candidatus Thiomargarita nelsonii TaxID=1003181 RepID=A0A176S4Y0_9GAMM|nr:hypothetical protein THIOM_001011 [Candidatus Thiomargarita nelsonii]
MSSNLKILFLKQYLRQFKNRGSEVVSGMIARDGMKKFHFTYLPTFISVKCPVQGTIR